MKTIEIHNNHEKILAGLNKAADIVKSTMGASGKNVIVASNDRVEPLKFTKDGVSVAKSIKLPDPIENIGAQILISAANKTVEECGDGTTLTCVLTQGLIQEVFELIKDKDIIKELSKLDKAVDEVKEFLKKEALEIKTTDDIRNIATVSSKSDRLGNMFAEIYTQTGFDTLINLEKSEHSNKTYYEISKGITFTGGFIHPSFMTNKDTEQAIYEDAYIYIEHSPINRVSPRLQSLLENLCINQGVPLIIIAPKFSDGFMRQMSMNKVNNSVNVCLVKTPGYGHGLKKNIEDITSYLSPADDTDVYGFVDRVVMDAYKMIIYNDDTPRLNARIRTLESLRENAVEWFDEKDYNERIHALQGSTVTIFTGGQTAEELNEEYDRIEDAIGAVQSALQQGYVVGGGLALFKSETLHKELKSVLKLPLKQIMSNANVVDVFKTYKNPHVGYNVKTHKYENFLESGIIDPVKVLIIALDTAVASTKLLINTEFTLYNEYKQSIGI
jgi:chaperonin GroEL